MGNANKSPSNVRVFKQTNPPDNPIPPAARPTKAIQDEREQRILYTIKMILDGRQKHEIKRFFRTQYGVKARQVERYLRLARARLCETNLLDLEQMRAEFYARYMEIFRSAQNDGTKLSALRAAGTLYGVDAPQKVAETTVDGKDKEVVRATVKGLTVEQLRVLRDAKNRLTQIAMGDSEGQN